MNKEIVFIAVCAVGLVISTVIGHNISQIMYQQPIFHYNDKVRFVKGFNKGREGICESHRYWMGYHYWINEGCGVKLHALESELEYIEELTVDPKT